MNNRSRIYKIIRNFLNKLITINQHALVILSVYFICVFLYVTYFRLNYPFELVELEGGGVEIVSRILSGAQIYTKPTFRYIPQIYPPLYFYITSVVALFMGRIDISILRAVSLAATILSVILIFRWVFRETGSMKAALFSAACYVGTYQLTNGYMTAARVDSLFVLLILGSLYALKNGRRYLHYFISAALLVLSIYTKQTGLFVAFGVTAYILIFKRRYLWVYLVVYLLGAVWYVLLNQYSQGWFHIFVFKSASNHIIANHMIFGYWAYDIAANILILCVLTVYGLRKRNIFPERKFYSYMAIIICLLSWMGRLNLGGQVNTLLPIYAFVSITAGIAADKIIFNNFNGSNIEDIYKRACVVMLLIFQFAIFLYQPQDYIPSNIASVTERNLIERIRNTKGDVFIPSHSYLAFLAGKDEHANINAIQEVMGDAGNFSPLIDNISISEEYANLIRNRKFKMIILDHFDCCMQTNKYERLGNYLKLIEKNYRRSDRVVLYKYSKNIPFYIYEPVL